MMKRWIAGMSGVAFGLLLTGQTWACNTLDDGFISKVDSTKSQVVVAKGDAKQTFTTADKTQVTINGKAATLADVKAGDKVQVDFETDTDVLAIKVTRAG